jgi:AraC-like DNA-binding protein
VTLLQQALTYIEALDKREITLRAVAEALQCNESYLSRVLKPHRNTQESAYSKRQKHAKLLESRREMRKRHAFSVKSGHKSLKKGAADARCSERTLRRYMERLG